MTFERSDALLALLLPARRSDMTATAVGSRVCEKRARKNDEARRESESCVPGMQQSTRPHRTRSGLGLRDATGSATRNHSNHGASSWRGSAAKTAPRWIGFASGVVAGATGVLVGHAFDTLKVQAQVGAGPSQPSGATAEPALHRILALYRGIVPPLLTTGAIRSLYFGVFETVRPQVARRRFEPRCHCR